MNYVIYTLIGCNLLVIGLFVRAGLRVGKLENALKDIKNISVRISIKTVERLIKDSVDKNKLEKIYNKGIEQAKNSLKHSKI